MSPLLKIISLQWEGRDAYNFSISNCVVSLHADRNHSIISSLLLISPACGVYFPFYGKPYIYYDIKIKALGRPFHHKNIIFLKVLPDQPREMARSSIVLNSYCMVTKVPGYLRPKIFF